MQLNDAQRKKLGELLHNALVEIRKLAEAGKSQQAADLAYAVHNMANDMWDDDFALEQFCDLYLKEYETKYTEGRIFGFVEMARDIIEMGEDPTTN